MKTAPDAMDAAASVEHRPLRLAMFSPVPPTHSGIAAYLADLLPLLPEAWDIDVFTDAGVEPVPHALQRAGGSTRQGGGPRAHVDGAAPSDAEAAVPCFAHTEFLSRNETRPYDLNIYQVGNSTAGAHVYDYVTAHPGLLVLHDGVVHPARVGAAIAAADVDGYRRMASSCRADVGAAVGHLVAGGLGGPALYRTFPMCEDLARASRVTAMHGELACGWLRALVPEASVVSVTHWRSVDIDRARRDAWRRRLGTDDEVIIGSFGNIGPERRLDRVFRALADDGAAKNWRLAVAGVVASDLHLEELAADLGIAERISWLPDLDDAEFVAVMGAVDLAVNLRYPPARASSGVLHQLLQIGVPAVISDVLHWRDYPDAAVARVPPGPEEAEHEVLAQALGRWLIDPERRAAAGSAAAAWAAAHLTPEKMRDDYIRAVGLALEPGRARVSERPENSGL